jgi:nicotinamide mononucleotide adenylyltransferase
MANNIVAIYAGRFHPFHKGHKAVYDSLVGKFGADNVFIATSGKQNDTDSPFSFKEKAAMMMLTGIPGKSISQEVSPYKPENILK